MTEHDFGISPIEVMFRPGEALQIITKFVSLGSLPRDNPMCFPLRLLHACRTEEAEEAEEAASAYCHPV